MSARFTYGDLNTEINFADPEVYVRFLKTHKVYRRMMNRVKRSRNYERQARTIIKAVRYLYDNFLGEGAADKAMSGEIDLVTATKAGTELGNFCSEETRKLNNKMAEMTKKIKDSATKYAPEGNK